VNNINIEKYFRDMLTDNISVVDIVDIIIGKAIDIHASDIHIDPYAEHLLVRFRIDGILIPVTILPINIHSGLISRLKILSNTRTDIHFVPQDGRWRSSVAGRQCDFRISFMPTYHGENSVIRILIADDFNKVGLDNIGFSIEQLDKIRTNIHRSHGMILVVGPTGSGKTTTLYACIREIASPDVSIITLEDPVEYEMPNIRQVIIRNSQGMTFASSLRASLRQDPDIIMLGEIRDTETAKVAIHTALTGHLVLSTLHTNSALEVIPRLMDMGIDPYLLSSTLCLVIAQRLVRKICIDCEGSGCSVCYGSGYRGRTIIAELLEVDSFVENLINQKLTPKNLTKTLQNRGFVDMFDHGLEKIDWGVVDRKEVVRVLSE
jgi:type IV pilus assembly protein PilB